MFRDRTNLFLSYRRTFPHNLQVSSKTRDPFLDLEDVNGDESFPMMDLDKGSQGLPPQFMDLTEQIDEHLSSAETQMIQLTKLYRKNSLPGFEDKSSDEKEIEELSFRIIKLFQQCYNVMKALKSIQSAQQFRDYKLNKGDLIILDNLQKKYANDIQSSSNKFRMLQNSYLKFLNKDDFKPLPSATTDKDALLMLEEEEGANATSQQEIDSYSMQTLQRQTERQMGGRNTQFLQQREEEITQLARGVLEVSTIFREMQNMIIDQGTIIDRIDYNLENTVVELKGAQRELERATIYQKRTQKCKVILLLSLVVVALFFVVMLKPHHHSSGNNYTQGKSSGKEEHDKSSSDSSDASTKPKIETLVR